MKPGFGGSRGEGSGRGTPRPFDKFRRDGRIDRNAPIPDQRFGGPGKPGFPKPKDESTPGEARGRYSRDSFRPQESRDPRGSSAPRGRGDSPSEERPFFPKSSPASRGGEDRPYSSRPQRDESRGQGGFRQGGYRSSEERSQSSRPPRDGFRNSEEFTRSPRAADQGESRPARARREFAPEGERPVRAARVTNQPEEITSSDLVCGIHAVEALLENSPYRVQRLLLLRGNNDTRLHKMQALAEASRIPCQQIEMRYLDAKVPGTKHQGVIALCNAREYADWSQVHAKLLQEVAAGSAPVVLVASAIEDPRNLGAIARTCVGLEVAALLLPLKGGCGLTALADETSAGALSQLSVTRPPDLEKTLRELASEGFAIVGLDADGDDIRTVDFTGPVVIVAGGEDRGIPPHMRRPCTRVASIPMSNKLQSYNASVAAALALWEVRRSR